MFTENSIGAAAGTVTRVIVLIGVVRNV